MAFSVSQQIREARLAENVAVEEQKEAAPTEECITVKVAVAEDGRCSSNSIINIG